jgi:hypothetical protein
MRAGPIPVALLLFASPVLAGPGPMAGTEDIPKLMAESTLVCKGEVTQAPEPIFVSTDPIPPPAVSAAYLYGCNEECFREFGPRVGATEPYDVTFTATAVPEPATAGLLTLSTLLVMGARSFWQRKRRPGQTAN